MKKRVVSILLAVMISFSVITMTSYRAYCETDPVYTEDSNIYSKEEPEEPEFYLPPWYVCPE